MIPVFPIVSRPHTYNVNSKTVLQLAMEIRYTPPPNSPPRMVKNELRSVATRIIQNCDIAYNITPLEDMPFNYRGAKRAKYLKLIDSL